MVVTALWWGYFSLLKDIDANIGTIMEMYQQRTNFSMEDVQVIFKEIKFKFIMAYIYLFNAMFIYDIFSLDKKNYENWKFHMDGY